MRTSWIVILFLLAALCDAVAAGRSGEVAPLARNRALESNEAVGETVLGMRSSDGYSLMIGLSKAHKLQTRHSSALVLSRPAKCLVVGLSCLPLDKQRSTQMVREHILSHFAETSETIPVGLLAVKLADEIYRRDQVGTPLVFNALLLGQSSAGPVGEEKNARKLLKVDQTASFFDCDAIAVGYKAEALNQWLLKHFSPQSIHGLQSLMDTALACLREAKPGPSQCEICVAVPNGEGIFGPFILERSTLKALLDGEEGEGAKALCAFVEEIDHTVSHYEAL